MKAKPIMEGMVQPAHPASEKRTLRIRRYLTFIFGEWPADIVVTEQDGKVLTVMSVERRRRIMLHGRQPNMVFNGFNGSGEPVWKARYGSPDNDSE